MLAALIRALRGVSSATRQPPHVTSRVPSHAGRLAGTTVLNEPQSFPSQRHEVRPGGRRAHASVTPPFLGDPLGKGGFPRKMSAQRVWGILAQGEPEESVPLHFCGS